MPLAVYKFFPKNVSLNTLFNTINFKKDNLIFKI